tara:strand:- start:427 stop:1362 length:936 start_codon:yes stop_codon:yes gene_type:complete
MKTDITTLETQYADLHSQSLDIGKQLAASIDMLSIGDTKELIARSIVEMESLVNRKESMLERLPFMGKYFAKARDAAKEESIKSGNMVKTVERLFTTLKTKKDNMMEIMEEIYKIREFTKQYAEHLESQKNEITEYLEEIEGTEDDLSMEATKAKNLLVQVSPSLIKARDNVATMNGILNTAQMAATKISAMLPALQGEMQTELAINAGLSELKEFKEVFDATSDLIHEVSYTNSQTLYDTVLEVTELEVSDPKHIARLEDAQAKRNQLNKELVKRREKQLEGQKQTMIRLEKISANQVESLALMDKTGVK